MIELRESSREEISTFVMFENSDDTAQFIVPYSPAKHLEEMFRDDTAYLSIDNERKLVGFIILVLDGIESVEFRRIVVTSKGKGIGQSAIQKMEQYCRETLKRNRIWLDVFESNVRAQHLYKKLGYKQFKSGSLGGRRMYYLEKML